MKFIKKSNKILFFIIFLIASIFIFSKQTIGYEEDIKKITSKLRCMTCQNQTIFESDSDFSKDIKKIVKNKLQNNVYIELWGLPHIPFICHL